MRIDRWNAGELRRYHHPSRAVLVTGYNRRTGKKLAAIIPACSAHISCPLGRDVASVILRQWRAEGATKA